LVIKWMPTVAITLHPALVHGDHGVAHDSSSFHAQFEPGPDADLTTAGQARCVWTAIDYNIVEAVIAIAAGHKKKSGGR
jgi:hypothetical protein